MGTGSTENGEGLRGSFRIADSPSKDSGAGL